MVEGVRMAPHCNGVKLIGCPYKFHHIAGKNEKKTTLALHALRAYVWPCCSMETKRLFHFRGCLADSISGMRTIQNLDSF